VNNLRVLITGGAGYIGSHMVRCLLKAGNAEVIVYDDLSTGHREAAGDAGFVRGNIADGALLGKVLTREKIDCVIHFAAKSLVGDSQKHPMVYYTNNVAATLSLLNTMLACNVRNIVFSSTAAVYGEPLNIPVTEEDPKEPTNVYGKTKLFIEHILEDYSQAYGLNYVSLRYFNAAGADESGEIGEDHNPETHLIPLILQHVLGKRESFELYGVDYPTKDGTCIRDFIHVNDLAEAHLLSLEALNTGRKIERLQPGKWKRVFSKRSHRSCSKTNW